MADLPSSTAQAHFARPLLACRHKNIGILCLEHCVLPPQVPCGSVTHTPVSSYEFSRPAVQSATHAKLCSLAEMALQHAIIDISVRSTHPAKQSPSTNGATRVPAAHSEAENRPQEGPAPQTMGLYQKSTHVTQQPLDLARQPAASHRRAKKHSMARQTNCLPCVLPAVPQGNACDCRLCSNIGSSCRPLLEAWVLC